MKYHLGLEATTGEPQLFNQKGHAEKWQGNKDTTELDIPTDKEGLKAAVQELLTRTWNAECKIASLETGGEIPVTDGQPIETEADTDDVNEERIVQSDETSNQTEAPTPVPLPPSFHELWEALPIVTKMYYAGTACEEARDEMLRAQDDGK